MVATATTNSSSSLPSPPPTYLHHNNDGKSHKNIDYQISDYKDDDSIKYICAQLAHRLNIFLETRASSPLLGRVQAQTRIALEVIRTALEQYSLEEISLSFNGGKDCLVMLILFLSAIATSPDRNTTNLRLPRRINSVYVMTSHPFPEVDSFVQSCESTYRLNLVRYPLPMKAAFTLYLNEHKKIKAIFVGTRRTDPHGTFLTHFDETDSGWPHFMRIHPIIDWKYTEVWAFIRHFEIPYCTLYDQGFTSLGGITDTHPNPALKLDEKSHRYKPAYELLQDGDERLGRD